MFGRDPDSRAADVPRLDESFEIGEPRRCILVVGLDQWRHRKAQPFRVGYQSLPACGKIAARKHQR